MDAGHTLHLIRSLNSDTLNFLKKSHNYIIVSHFEPYFRHQSNPGEQHPGPRTVIKNSDTYLDKI